MADGEGQDLAFVLNDLNARIRVLETRYSLFGERLLIVNQNMIDEYKKLMRSIKTADDELKEVKHDLFNLKEIISGLTKEMGFFARKDSLQVLEKYINLWNPMNFVTEKDVINLIRHNEDVMLKEDFLSAIDQHKKEVLDMLSKEIEERILTKKEVLDLIKKESGKNSK